MKNVYMFQPNYLYGKNAYLPYAIGALAAYAWSDERIKKSYALKQLGYLREDISIAVQGLSEPYLCAFSCYTWNYEYNKALACAIKKAYPACKIVFGGHQIAPGVQDSSSDYVDVYIYDEGEIPFKALLLALDEGSSLSGVPNIKYKTGEGSWAVTEQEMVIASDFPSPYLMGLFDEMMKDDSLDFTPTLETNRGCPFSCAYCDWGIYKSKLRQFPIERVKAEIDWFSEHKIDLIFGADSNFGILERDEEIIDYMIYKKRTTGYPRKFRVAYTKNTGERVFEINRRLNEEGMCKGATLSFQSMNEKTLEAVGRKNVPLKYFSELMEMYNGHNIPTYSEIIMGLPEETYESFCSGIDHLLENGQHTSINIYLCELLPNSAMAKPNYIKKYGIKTKDTILNQYHCLPEEGPVVEHSKIVVGTKSLSFQDWKKTYYFSLVVQSFHCLGLTRYIAIYLHYELSVPYHDFYQGLLVWCMENDNTVAGKSFCKMLKIFEIFWGGGGKEQSSLSYLDSRFGEYVWPLEEAWYLEMLYEKKDFYDQLKRYLEEKYTDFMASPIGCQLFEYQKEMVYCLDTVQKEIDFNYDFLSYFAQLLSGEHHKLKQGEFKYKSKVDNKIYDWPQFATEIVWYGRKGGKNHIQFELV